MNTADEWWNLIVHGNKAGIPKITGEQYFKEAMRKKGLLTNNKILKDIKLSFTNTKGEKADVFFNTLDELENFLNAEAHEEADTLCGEPHNNADNSWESCTLCTVIKKGI